jgi:putative restriction endonuclease
MKSAAAAGIDRPLQAFSHGTRSPRFPLVRAMPNATVGHVPGHPPGTHYDTRAELHAAGIHRPLRAGIAGSQRTGATSVVLSGGYVDDEDHGTWILYTGQGGRDPDSGRQVRDQRFNRGNKALARSCMQGAPVRVVRGARSASRWAPEAGYRYDGLFRVEQYWRAPSQSGPMVWRFRIRGLPGESYPSGRATYPSGRAMASTAPQSAGPVPTTVRGVRETAQGRQLKALYDHRCQVCGERLDTEAGPYAEAASIRPLEPPHYGPDAPNNLLCLCPNHHVLFDHGAFGVRDDHTLVGRLGSLIMHAEHTLDPAHLRYHRTRILHALPDDRPELRS